MTRIHGMDALRAIAMLLGIVLHAVIAYRVFPNAAWPSDAHQWIGYDALYLWIHSFRMQVFFLVAGFFARLLYLKIGESAFLQHRLKRIVVPFVLSVIILVPLSIAPFLYYNYAEEQGMDTSQALLAMVHGMFGWNGLVHLWFLYYLLMFYATMMAMIRLAQQMPVLKNISRRLSFLADLTNPVAIVSLVVLIVTILTFQGKLILEAYTGIKPNVAQFMYYGLFFGIGYWIHQRSDLIEKISTRAIPYLLIGSLLVVPLTYLYAAAHGISQPNSSTYAALVRLIGACQTVLLVGGVLGGFIRFFTKENRTLRYVSDAAYWLYLIHLPIVAWLQILLLHSSIYGVLRFWLIIIITACITLTTYQWFVRYTIVGNVLHGERRRMSKRERLAKQSIS